jgi:TetR/AcrR family transcriptional regulator
MQKSTTRDIVLQEARKLFTANGFASTSIRQICAEAGVTAPVLYYHFGDKEGLFQAVVEDTLSLDGFHRLLREEVAASSDAWTKLQTYVRAYLTHYPTELLNPGLHLNNSTQLHGASLRQLGSGIEAIYQLAKEILQGGIATGKFREVNVDTMAACLVGTIDSFVRAKVYLGAEYDLEEVARCIVDLFTWGLAVTSDEASEAVG